MDFMSITCNDSVDSGPFMSLKQLHYHRRRGLKKNHFTQSRWSCIISWLFGSWQEYTRSPVHRRTHTIPSHSHTTGIIYLCVFSDCRRKRLSLTGTETRGRNGNTCKLITPCKSQIYDAAEEEVWQASLFPGDPTLGRSHDQRFAHSQETREPTHSGRWLCYWAANLSAVTSESPHKHTNNLITLWWKDQCRFMSKERAEISQIN